MVWKFYNSVTKELKKKTESFQGLIHTFVEVTREKLLGGGVQEGAFCHSVLNRTKAASKKAIQKTAGAIGDLIGNKTADKTKKTLSEQFRDSYK